MGGSDSKPEGGPAKDLASKYEPAFRPEATQIGYNASRHCTDLCGLLLFILCWIAMMVVSSVAFRNGDPRRILYGTDFEGRLCGQSGDEPSVTLRNGSDGQPLQWSAFDKIAFPWPSETECAKYTASNKPPTCEDVLRAALNRGICVNRCPDDGDRVMYYDGSEYAAGKVIAFTSSVRTEETIHRCLPISMDYLKDNIPEALDIAGTFGAAVRELKESAVVIFICFGACIVICYLWLFILRRTVKPTVFLSLFLLFLILGALTYLFYNQYRRAESKTSGTSRTWLALAIVTGAAFVIYTFLLIFFCKNINIACDTIEEASKIPISIPTMAAVPPLIALAIIPFVVFHTATALYIQTSGKLSVKDVENYTVAGDAGNELQVKVFTHDNWQTIAHLYNLFMLLWTMGTLNAFGFLTLAFCAVFWYWSVPGDHKRPQGGVVKGMVWTLRYHLGTIMVGSLIIAVIQMLRYLMMKFEDRMRKIADNPVANCAVKYVQCCLACFERLIKFISRNAYIMTAMCSDGFCGGAKRALFLLLRHAASVIAVNLIADWVMFFGKVQITALTTALGWALLTQTDTFGVKGREASDCILTLLVIALVAFVIASIFVEVFSACVDTVLLCFCHDIDVNNGADKPYYLPKDLQRSLDCHNKTNHLQEPLLQR